MLASSPSREVHLNKTCNGESVDSRNGKYLRRDNAPLAQPVERLFYMQDVAGSIPAGCTKGSIGRVLIVSVKHRLGGSIPSAPTNTDVAQW